MDKSALRIHKLKAAMIRMGQNGQMKWSISDRTGTTEKSGPPRKVDRFFGNFFRLHRTDPFSFRPKFPEILVEWIAPKLVFVFKSYDNVMYLTNRLLVPPVVVLLCICIVVLLPGPCYLVPVAFSYPFNCLNQMEIAKRRRNFPFHKHDAIFGAPWKMF